MYFDFKVKIWQRITVPTKYENIIFEKIKSGEITSGDSFSEVMAELDNDGLMSKEILYKTEEQMEPIENDNQCTIEVLNDDKTTIWANISRVIYQESSKTFRKMPENYLLISQTENGWLCNPDLAIDKELAIKAFTLLLEHENKYEKNPYTLLGELIN